LVTHRHAGCDFIRPGDAAEVVIHAPPMCSVIDARIIVVVIVINVIIFIAVVTIEICDVSIIIIIIVI
jgi:hypothetical protein